MAEITTTYKENLSLGNRDAVVAKTAAIDNHNTFTTGLSVIEHVSFTNATSGATGGYTVSGGVITFHLSGSFGASSILAIGFN
jgi:hypothetical protein